MCIRDSRSLECVVCRKRGMFRLKHKHFSTVYQRQVVTAAGRDVMDCAVCQTSHSAKPTSTRVKVLFSSSTCNGWYQAKDWTGTDNYHVDVEAVGGLTLPLGERMWKTMYDDYAGNVDTHIVVGLNDVLALARMPDNPRLSKEEQTAQKVKIFMERVQSWYNTSEEQAARHNLAPANRLSLSTLPRPMLLI